MKNNILSFIYSFSGLFKNKRDIYVFGAWDGQRYSDNPRYLFEYYENMGHKVYWIGDKLLIDRLERNSDARFVKRGSLKSFFILMRAKYIFISHSFRDVSRINFFKNSTKIQLWHGFPLKKIVADVKNDPGQQNLFYENYDYFLSSSSLEDQRLLSAFRNWNISEDKLMRYGQPRNDIFQNKMKMDMICAEIKKNLGLEKFKKIILYLPTFRDKTEEIYSFYDKQDIIKFLEKNNYVLLERQHFQRRKTGEENQSSQYVKVLDESIDTQELLVLADLLITDYSSVFMDYAILERPIIHFLYDNDEYLTFHRGIYGKFSDECAGPIVYNEKDLAESIFSSFNDENYGKENRVNARYLSNEYNSSNNCEQIYQFLSEHE